MRRGDRLSIGAGIPGFCLPALAVLVAAGGAMLLGVQGGWLFAVAALALIGVLVPQVGALWMAAGALVIALTLTPPDPARTAIAIAAVHLLHVLAALSLAIPAGATVALRALAPTAFRFAAVQAVAQAVGLALALVVDRLDGGGAVPIAVVGGATAVLALALSADRLMRARRPAAYRVPR